MKKNKSLVPIEALEEALGGDKELVLFFLAWIKNGRIASHAYKSLNPNVTDESSAVLGHRMYQKLREVNLSLILESYGLGPDKYFSKLQEGLEATKFEDLSGGGFGKDEVPDYNARRKYHEALGKMLKVEGMGDSNTNNIGISIKIENYGGSNSKVV